LKGHINAVAAFQEGQRAGTVIEANQITQRVLAVAVPRDVMTSEQAVAIQRAAAYARSQNVILTIVEMQ